MKDTVHSMREFLRLIAWIALLASTVALNGCNTNVGVGMSVGVPVGRSGYMSVGGTRWL